MGGNGTSKQEKQADQKQLGLNCFVPNKSRQKTQEDNNE